jgi:DNA-binding SARP family transcriptional activator/tetratricopeptide (TPR) repeat protein
MLYRLLGPLEIWDGSCWHGLRQAKWRALLAVLLCRANQAVSAGRLIEELWGQQPPKSAGKLLHACVSDVRRALGDSSGETLVTRAPGYELRTRRGELDCHHFEDLATRGRQAFGDGAFELAATRLGEALALWRGPALADVPASPTVQAEAARLEAGRLGAVEALVETELARGRHADVLPELHSLVRQHPLREGLHGQLMLALYRAGRQAEALAVLRDLRRVLVEELGLEPGPALQNLQRQILAADPALLVGQPRPSNELAVARPATVEPPRQLPPTSAIFAGREDESERLRALLRQDGKEPVAIATVYGIGGIGKSALAIHVAHQLAGEFPDGQLYADLHGATAGVAPLEPLELLGRFLRALGVDGSQVPAQVDEAAARLRSLTAGRRLLLVLDNVRDTSQVAPLLPGGPGCGVLITSRRVLAGLDGAGQLHLGVLTPQEAVALLGRLIGEQRIAAEPTAADELARWCGWLPLALRIAGARLTARPGWPVRALAERLADARCRLDELELSDIGVRASFRISYTELGDSPNPNDRTAAEAFSLLGMLDGPAVGVPVVARLLDQPEPTTDRVLERLVDAQLLETPSPGRYRMHDLLRVYAREQATRQYSQQQAAALRRAFGLYVATCWHTLDLLCPGDQRLTRADDRWSKGGLEFADEPAALGWLEAERANLLAAVQQAAITPGVPSEFAVQFAQALFGFFRVRGYWNDWVRVNQTALAVANQLGDRPAQAQAQNDLGLAHSRQGQYEQALAYHQQSLAIYQNLGDHRGQAASLNNLGIVYQRQGQYDQALACHQQSLTIKRELGDRHGQANSLGNLGLVHQRRGHYDQALACHRQSLTIYRELGHRDGQANSLNDLGLVHLQQARYEQALACQRKSLAMFRELGDRDGQANSLNDLGLIHQRQGRYDQALACHRQSLTIRGELGDPYGQAESLRDLGGALQALGRHQEKRAHWQQALAIFEQLQCADADGIRILLTDTN